MKNSKFSRSGLIAAMAHKIAWSPHPAETAVDFIDLGNATGLSDEEAEKFSRAACVVAPYRLDPKNAARLFAKLREVYRKNERRNRETTFKLILKKVGPNKNGLINEVAATFPFLGLAGATTLVESTPCTVCDDVNKDEAYAIKIGLEEFGATVEVE